MHVRQSDLKLWGKCPLMYHFDKVEGIPREQSASLTYGSVIHDCVNWMEVHQDLEGAILRFKELWIQPTLLDPTYEPSYYVRGTSWHKFNEAGPKALRDWFSIVSWDSALVLGREHQFSVPIGDGHFLDGTADKIEYRYRADIGAYVICVVDYKTDKKRPTYDFLNEDLQFTAYSYASLRPEFWTGIGGQVAFERYQDLPRYGEWVQLTGPKRMDAGPRIQRHYNRLTMAVNAFAQSVSMRIFVPNISGESCRYCDYRGPCGLPELDPDGNLTDV